MKRKELKNLAKKIAGYEGIVQTSSDVELVERAKNEIIKLTGKISSIEDLELLDGLIIEILNQDNN